MIKITCKKDIEKLNKPDIACVFKKYIEDYLNEMLLRFDCNLSNFGSIFVLESENELEIFSPSKASHFINVGLVYAILRIDYIHNFTMITYATDIPVTFRLTTDYIHDFVVI